MEVEPLSLYSLYCPNLIVKNTLEKRRLFTITIESDFLFLSNSSLLSMIFRPCVIASFSFTAMKSWSNTNPRRCWFGNHFHCLKALVFKIDQSKLLPMSSLYQLAQKSKAILWHQSAERHEWLTLHSKHLSATGCRKYSRIPRGFECNEAFGVLPEIFQMSWISKACSSTEICQHFSYRKWKRKSLSVISSKCTETKK